MAKNRIIHAPRTYKIEYRDDNGEPVEMSLALNREYEVRCVDGTKRFVTIRNITSEKTNNTPSIEFDLQINPGFMGVLTQYREIVPVDQIREIKLVHATYTRSKRSYRKGTENAVERPDTESFTFEFKSFYYSRPYRLIVYANEFVALITSGVNGSRINNYGCIEDVTDTDIIFTKYVNEWGNRSIQCGVHIPIADLIGIYRFTMGIEPYDESKRSKKKDETKDDVPAEGTILSIE